MGFFETAPPGAPSSFGETFGGRAPVAAATPSAQISGNDGCLEKARASMTEIRVFSKVGSTKGALQVDSKPVPTGYHWILYSATFMFRNISGIFSNPPASGVFICGQGAGDATTEDLNGVGTNLLNMAARQLRIDDGAVGLSAQVAGSDRFETYRVGNVRIYVPSGCFVRGIANGNNITNFLGDGYLRLLLTEEENCG